MNRFFDSNGDIHKLDSHKNHFVNGKCVNPKSWEATQIGETFTEFDGIMTELVDKVEITGHVPVFTHGLDPETDKPYEVNTGCEAW